jgi:hypothetical protein
MATAPHRVHPRRAAKWPWAKRIAAFAFAFSSSFWLSSSAFAFSSGFWLLACLWWLLASGFWLVLLASGFWLGSPLRLQ